MNTFLLFELKPGHRSFVVNALALLALCGLLDLAPAAGADLWTTAYYPGYEENYLPPSAIDFTVVTHVIHFSLLPKTDGSLDSTRNSITPTGAANLVAQAHLAGRKALICVGGSATETGFQGATSAAHLAAFINNVTNFVSTYGYDGVDLDWEPLPAADFNLYTNLVNGLRLALNGFATHKLMTVAMAAYPVYGDPPNSEAAMFVSLQGQFDQMNLMTYDLAGPYAGWVTWFNSPVSSGGYRFPSTGGLLPSVEGAVTNFLANGMPAGKLGIGVAFYGDIWAGGTGTSTGGAALPRQSWTSPPTMSQAAYYNIMATYYQSNLYHWDIPAQAAYLSIDKSGSTNDNFITYDDEHTCQVKVNFARAYGLGGLMIWELGQGYLPSNPAGQRNPLLQALKQSLAMPSINQFGTNVVLSWPLGTLQQSDFVPGSWSDLLDASSPFTNPTSGPSKYFRVKLP